MESEPDLTYWIIVTGHKGLEVPRSYGAFLFVMRHRYSADNPDNYRDGAHAVVVQTPSVHPPISIGLHLFRECYPKCMLQNFIVEHW